MMFSEAIDHGDPRLSRERAPRRWWASLPFRVVLALAGLALAYGLASAQMGQLSSCSQTVGATAAAVAFPTAGSTGNPRASVYIEICNAHASNTLGVNFTGGTAAIGSEGTLTLTPGGCMWWNQAVIPAALSVIGSAASTTTACGYK